MSDHPPEKQDSSQSKHTYVVEHLDPELGPWSSLEYISISLESSSTGNSFLLTSVPQALQLEIQADERFREISVRTESIEEFLANEKEKICLLDPAAKEELSPEDGDIFTTFLFGGILGMMDHIASGFSWIYTELFFQEMILLEVGHYRGRYHLLSLQLIDRTSELRTKGYHGRRLGPKQMTTDTAVRVTRMVVQDKSEMTK
jgi:ribosome biogenesis SPOUT family RNA methylase Rps3